MAQSAVTKAENATTIDGLNDDCLILVLEYLGPPDLFYAEKVSTRWQSIVARVWARKSLRHQLVFADPDANMQWRFPSCHSDVNLRRLFDDNKVNEASLRDFADFLGRFGQFFVGAALATKLHSLDIIGLIADYCPNLEWLKLSDMYVLDYSMARMCGRLRKIKVMCVFDVRSNLGIMPHLEHLLANNLELKSVTINNVDQNTGKWLSKITGQKLKSIKLTVRDTIFDMIYLARNPVITEHVEHFTLIASRAALANVRGLFNMRRLKTLQLSLHDRQTNDDLLESIYRNLKNLEVVEIMFGSGVTGAGIEAIFHLPRLKRLYITDRTHRNCPIWSRQQCNVPNLTMLLLNEFYVSEEPMCQLIERMPKLTNLYIDRCRFYNQTCDEFILRFVTMLAERHFKKRVEVIKEERDDGEFLSFIFHEFQPL